MFPPYRVHNNDTRAALPYGSSSRVTRAAFGTGMPRRFVFGPLKAPYASAAELMPCSRIANNGVALKAAALRDIVYSGFFSPTSRGEQGRYAAR